MCVIVNLCAALCRTPKGTSAKDYFMNLKQLCTVKTIKVSASAGPLIWTSLPNLTACGTSLMCVRSLISSKTSPLRFPACTISYSVSQLTSSHCSTYTLLQAFWGVVNNIRPVSELGSWESYHLMQGETRRPTWEDLDNAHGGAWTIKIYKKHTVG